MRFKIDENLPVEIAELLISAGHDAKTVNDEHLQGKPDSTLAHICKKEHRVFVTIDMDFSDIRSYPPKDFSGLMVLRTFHQDKNHLLKTFNRILPMLKQEPLKNCLWIVEESRVRIRNGE